jgi:hypothetical protein
MIPCLGHGSKRDGWKVGGFAAAAPTRNEADDFRAHDSPSSTVIAIRNMSASEIRYTVIHCGSLKRKMRGMIAEGAIISGANPIPWRGPPAGASPRTAHRRVRARRPIWLKVMGFGRRRACANAKRESEACSQARRHPIPATKKPAAVSGAGFELLAMMSVCY